MNDSPKRPSPKKKTTSQRKVTAASLIKSERFHFLTGILIAFFGIYVLLSLISFFFTGTADQSYVLNRTLSSLINDETIQIQNWGDALGAILGEQLINGGFGIFALFIPIFIVYLGLKQMKVIQYPFFKAFFLTAFLLICGSITSEFILGKLFPINHLVWGGRHGNQVVQILENSIGLPGIILLILFFVIIFVVLVRKNSMYKIQDTLINNKPNFNKSTQENIEKSESIIEENIENETKIPFWKKLFPRKSDEIVEDEETVGSEPLEEEEEVINEIHFPNTPQPIFPKSRTRKPGAEPAITDDFEIVVPKEEDLPQAPLIPTLPSQTEAVPEVTNENEGEMMEDYDPKKDLSSFEFPSLQLLKMYDTSGKEVDMKEQTDNKNKIIHTLRNYGIEITSIKATVGPTITLYEIVPKAGVRISKIKNLEDDIALSLSALGIRIIAPMPGKGTIGIEVPNKDPQIVSMQSVIASKKFQECTYDLPVALGKTITNEVFIFDLTKMPHLLVAGATGQGKSVGLNAIITSLLYKKHPSELKMVLVDPKMVEFNIYSTIERHYLAKLPDEEKAIITDVSKVTQTLNSLTKEMDDRYELLMRANVRNIKEYNEKFIKRKLNPNKGHRYLPYLVIVIDEFGDLIMTAGKEIEMPIARIAQKARAVGMHMVIATQRPTTNIITGTIKANFPARMAFRVTSQIDSRTILDMNGANQLIGRGDMLFSQGSNLLRVQCAFVDTPEVESIAQYIGTQRGFEHAFALPEVIVEGSDDKPGAVDLNDKDSLFEEAARLIVVHQQGSTSLIQRKFSIGYNRAGRLMDQLEAAGIVGPTQGSKPREVYIQDEYSLEKLIDSLR